MKSGRLNEGYQFTYKKLSKEEMESRGILGRLCGVIADFERPTRNGRKYSREVWEKTLNDDIFREKIENKCIIGEIEHPEDHLKPDPSKGAIVLAEMPKFGTDGNLYGVFDIIDTPQGRVLNTYCKYGTKFGVSSRGDGQLNGNEVDPDSYDCECWDAVLMPAVKHARPNYVNESVSSKELKLRQSLNESLDAAETPDARKEMEEAIKMVEQQLNEIDTDEPKSEEPVEVTSTEDVKVEVPDNSEIEVKDINSEESTDEKPEGTEEEDTEALSEEDKAAIFLDYLETHFDKDALKNACAALNIEMEEDEDGNEELVLPEESDEIPTDDNSSEDIDETPKEDANEKEEVVDDKSNKVMESLQEALKAESDLNIKVKALNEQLAARDSRVEQLTEENNNYKSAIVRLSKLVKSKNGSNIKVSQLEESLKMKDAELVEKQNSINALVKEKENTVSLNESLNTKDTQIKTLTEKLSKQESETTIKVNKLTEDLNKSNATIEKHKLLEAKLINKYIENKATAVGVTSADVKRRLGAKYTIEDVDKICESLQEYQLNVSGLPFNVDKQTSIRYTPDKRVKSALGSKFDEDNDDSLMDIARSVIGR